jgi:hypothetical protein
MESRLHPREHVDLNVSLIRQGSVMALAKAVDLSQGGVAIEQPKVPLNKGQILDVNLSRSGHPRGTSLNVRAMVIHCNHDRVGLMFADQVRL